MERNETPCTDGLADRLELRRNSDRPGTCLNAASSSGAMRSCGASISVVENAALPTGSGGRAVMRTDSGAAGLSCAKAGAANPKPTIAPAAPTLTKRAAFLRGAPLVFGACSMTALPRDSFAHFAGVRYGTVRELAKAEDRRRQDCQGRKRPGILSLNSVRRHEFLHAFSRVDLARVQVPLRVHKCHVDEVEHPALMAMVADLADDLAGVAFELPDHIVHDVGDEDVFLARIGGKIDRTGRAAAQRVIGNEKLLEEFSLLGEDLDAVAGAVADINQAILGNAH